MTFEQAKVLSEELELIKFNYKGKDSHDKHPRVIVIDSEYPGRIGEKNYGKTKDVLGVNLRHMPIGERKKARSVLSQIDLFSDFLQADKLERYNRIKDFGGVYVNKYLRRYKRKGMSHVRVKRGLFYQPYSFTTKDTYFKEKE